MAEPYFLGQKRQPCGCYYPDVARTDKGAIHCCVHGWVGGQGTEEEIPTEEWRESERKRLKNKKQST